MKKIDGSKGSSLDQVKEILHSFIDEFPGGRETIVGSPCHEKSDAYAWVYGAKHYYPLMQPVVVDPLMQPVVVGRAVPALYLRPALPLFNKWLGLFLDVQNKESYRIPDPMKEETVLQYLERLQSILVEGNERRKIWWSSLRSFVDFLRNKDIKNMESLGELESIFPEEMMLYFDCILRKVPVTLYPVDIWVVAEILQNLAKIVLEGRSNSQGSAAQALGFAWVCLASGHARCMTRLECLRDVVVKNIKEGTQDDPFFPNHWVSLRTCFGQVEAPISDMVYKYLLSLPRTNSRYIFEMPLRSLRRSLDRAIAASNSAKGLGKITFFTFMHRSHEVRGYRFKGYKQ